MSRTFKRQSNWPKEGKMKKVKMVKQKFKNKNIEKYLEEDELSQ